MHICLIPFGAWPACRIHGVEAMTLARATQYGKMLESGMTRAEIAQAVNMSPAHVQQMLYLYWAPQSIKDQVENGTLTITEAVRASRSPDLKAIAAELLGDWAKEDIQERSTASGKILVSTNTILKLYEAIK